MLPFLFHYCEQKCAMGTGKIAHLWSIILSKCPVPIDKSAIFAEKIAHFFCSKSVLYDKISNKLICFFITYSLLFLELKNILNNYLNKGGKNEGKMFKFYSCSIET